MHRLLVALTATSLLLGCVRRDADVGLLSGKAPSQAVGIQLPRALTDGAAVVDGDHWRTDRTTVLEGPASFLIFDLGEPREVRAIWLQGDANDTYEVSSSSDGTDFQPLWAAAPVKAVGMQARSVNTLDATARFLRISASGGDGAYSLSELAVYENVPEPFPPKPSRVRGLPSDERIRSGILFLGLAVLAFCVLALEGRRRRMLALLALPAIAGYQLYAALQTAEPLTQREVSLARGVIALVAALVVLWDTFAPRRLAPDRRAVLGTLAICGLAGVLAFFNLGRPQFKNEHTREPTFVHLYDLRQYYGTAKYFSELSFWRMYEADVVAYAEDQNLSLDALGTLELRDLRTNRGTNVAALRESISTVKQRFTPARWEQYKSDARFFRETMGANPWLITLVDLGGNATPVWMTVAHFFFNSFDASLDSFFWLALLDPLLLLAMFLAIGFSFGPRTMFVSMAIFGANDFIMFGTNWAGSTLRHDWLALLGLGACALKKKRWVLAGAMLGLATSIRAFPAFAVIGLTFPAVWAVAEQWRASRRLPRPLEIIRGQRPTFLTGISAVLTVAVLVALTSLALSPTAWPEWLAKVGLLDAEVHANPVSLKTVIVGSDGSRPRLLSARQPIYLAAMVVYLAMIFLAARKTSLEQAAMLGLILLPVVMYPANYYLHVVCLLPMIVTDRRWAKEPEANRALDPADAWVWAAVLGVCAAQYFTTLVTDLHLHFYLASVLLMGGVTVLLIAIIRRDGGEALELFPRRPGQPP